MKFSSYLIFLCSYYYFLHSSPLLLLSSSSSSIFCSACTSVYFPISAAPIATAASASDSPDSSDSSASSYSSSFSSSYSYYSSYYYYFSKSFFFIFYYFLLYFNNNNNANNNRLKSSLKKSTKKLSSKSSFKSSKSSTWHYYYFNFDKKLKLIIFIFIIFILLGSDQGFGEENPIDINNKTDAINNTININNNTIIDNITIDNNNNYYDDDGSNCNVIIGDNNNGNNNNNNNKSISATRVDIVNVAVSIAGPGPTAAASVAVVGGGGVGDAVGGGKGGGNNGKGSGGSKGAIKADRRKKIRVITSPKDWLRFSKRNPFINSLPSSINVGAVFTHDRLDQEIAFKLAIKRINTDRIILPNTKLIPKIEHIQKHDSFHADKKVCGLLHIGVVAIFDPLDGFISRHLQSICDALDIPHLETRWDFTTKRDDLSVNLYPKPNVLARAYVDLVKKWSWEQFAIVYEDNEGLIRLQDFFKEAESLNWRIKLHQFKAGKPYRETFWKIKNDGEKNIILDVKNENIFRALKHAQQVGLITESHSYLITQLDLHTIDLEDFKFGKTKITAFKIIDDSNEELKLLREDWRQEYPKYYTPEISTESALIYDAVKLLATAIRELDHGQSIEIQQVSCETSIPWSHGSSLINYMRPIEFRGITGLVGFNDIGFRSSITLSIVTVSPNGLEEIGTWSEDIDHDKRLNISRDWTVHYSSSALENKTLIITTILNDPYTMIKDSSFKRSGNDQFEGYAIDLILELSKLLHFNYEFRLVKDGAYGRPDKEGNWNGMMGELIRGEADLAVADLTITSKREDAVDFTHPFMNTGISILYKKPTKKVTSLFSFLSPFSHIVWIYVVCAYIGVSSMLFIVGRISPYEWENPHPCRRNEQVLENAFSLSNSFWFTIGSLMQQASDLTPKAMSTRTIASIWYFFTLIMIASYTANLAAFLTVEKIVYPIENAEGLAAQDKIKYGCLGSGSTASFFSESNITTYKKMWEFMSKNPEVFMKSNEEGRKTVEKADGMYAYLMESASIEYIIERNCNLTQIGGLLDSKGYGIATRKDSPYRTPLSQAILKLQESGALLTLKERWWKQKKGGGKCIDDPKKSSGSVTPLKIDNVGGVFVVLLGGLSFSLFVVILEFVWRARYDQNGQNETMCEEMMNDLKFALMCQSSSKIVSNRRQQQQQHQQQHHHQFQHHQYQQQHQQQQYGHHQYQHHGSIGYGPPHQYHHGMGGGGGGGSHRHHHPYIRHHSYPHQHHHGGLLAHSSHSSLSPLAGHRYNCQQQQQQQHHPHHLISNNKQQQQQQQQKKNKKVSSSLLLSDHLMSYMDNGAGAGGGPGGGNDGPGGNNEHCGAGIVRDKDCDVEKGLGGHGLIAANNVDNVDVDGQPNCVFYHHPPEDDDDVDAVDAADDDDDIVVVDDEDLVFVDTGAGVGGGGRYLETIPPRSMMGRQNRQQKYYPPTKATTTTIYDTNGQLLRCRYHHPQQQSQQQQQQTALKKPIGTSSSSMMNNRSTTRAIKSDYQHNNNNSSQQQQNNPVANPKRNLRHRQQQQQSVNYYHLDDTGGGSGHDPAGGGSSSASKLDRINNAINTNTNTNTNTTTTSLTKLVNNQLGKNNNNLSKFAKNIIRPRSGLSSGAIGGNVGSSGGYCYVTTTDDPNDDPNDGGINNNSNNNNSNSLMNLPTINITTASGGANDDNNIINDGGDMVGVTVVGGPSAGGSSSMMKASSVGRLTVQSKSSMMGGGTMMMMMNRRHHHHQQQPPPQQLSIDTKTLMEHH